MAISESLRQAVLVRDNCRCRACGVSDPLTLEVDHIVPRSKGGTDHPSNLQALCPFCNNTKGDSEVPPMVARESVLGFGDYDTVMAERLAFQVVCENARQDVVNKLTLMATEWRAQGVRGLTIRKRLNKLATNGIVETVLKASK